MLTYVDTMIGFAGVMLLLSLLVTAVVQMASAALNLRGANLLWGVSQLIGKALPKLEDEKKREEIAKMVLKDPTMSPNGRLATAIRSDEFVRLLKQILDAEKQPQDISLAFKQAKDGWAQLYASIPVDDVAKLFPEDAKKAEEMLKRLSDKARQEMGDLKAWFDTVMDRTTERFVSHTRLISVGAAVLLAFVLQIDSLGILKQISGNPELRARLVHDADATLKLADDYGAKNKALATEALKAAIEETKAGKTPVTPEAPVAEGLFTRAQGAAWAEANVKEEDARKVLSPIYDDRYNALLPLRMKEIADSGAEIKKQLRGTELVVVDVKSPKVWWAWWQTDSLQHLFGVLLTMVFLSLGGPFWYNLLRQLANLRPLIAGKVDKDEQA